MASNEQHPPTEKDSHPVDSYDGKYKAADEGMSEAQKFGTNQLPVKNDDMPAKNLRTGGA